MKEKEIEEIIREYLCKNGWIVKPRINKFGIDIEATKGTRHAVVEVKGRGAHTTAMSNNFNVALGQILKDMTDTKIEYYVAFPKIEPYIRLWGKLPQLAKEITGIKAIFVEENGTVIGI